LILLLTFLIKEKSKAPPARRKLANKEKAFNLLCLFQKLLFFLPTRLASKGDLKDAIPKEVKEQKSLKVSRTGCKGL
jgi:hypothetical protein